MGQTEEEGKCGGRRGYKEDEGIAEEGSNKLLSAARRKRYGTLSSNPLTSGTGTFVVCFLIKFIVIASERNFGARVSRTREFE